MTLLRTSLLNTIAVLVRVLTTLGVNKVLAVQVGPSGYALIGRFQNFVTVLTTFASGAVGSGVTKYVAEYHDNPSRQNAVIKTAGSISLGASAVLGVALAVFHRPLSQWILLNGAYGGIFIWFALGLTAYTLNAFLLAILNGRKDVRRYVVINIAGSVIGGLLTAFLAIQWGLYGALVALVLNQSLLFVAAVAICWRAPWFDGRLVGRVDPAALRGLLGFVVMTAASAVCMPLSQIVIRNHIANGFGMVSAGHWEAVMRVSSLYLMLVTTPLAVYYLPRLSEIQDSAELKREIVAGYKLILPATGLGALLMFILRGWLVRVIFTRDFAPVADLLGWQLAGDVAKIGSWLLAYIMLSKAMVWLFVGSEVAFGLIWILLVNIFTAYFGAGGAQIAYCTSYLIYWVLLYYYLRKKGVLI